jgi:hypothetical protein
MVSGEWGQRHPFAIRHSPLAILGFHSFTSFLNESLNQRV